MTKGRKKKKPKELEWCEVGHIFVRLFYILFVNNVDLLYVHILPHIYSGTPLNAMLSSSKLE